MAVREKMIKVFVLATIFAIGGCSAKKYRPEARTYMLNAPESLWLAYAKDEYKNGELYGYTKTIEYLSFLDAVGYLPANLKSISPQEILNKDFCWWRINDSAYTGNFYDRASWHSFPLKARCPLKK